jgi:hypothetical protein
MLIKDAIARAKKDVGVSSDDSSLGSRYIYSHLKSVRSELLRQEIEKKGLWSNFTLQTLRRFELEQIDLTESDDITTGIYMLRSKLPFPELMDTKEGKINGGIFLPSGERIELSSHTAAANSLHRRYRSGKGLVYIRDNHLYIKYYDARVPRLYVDVDGLYENPEEVDRLNMQATCKDNQCVFYPDLPFYLPAYLEGRFFRMVKEDLAWSYRIPKDKTNNATEDIQNSPQTKQ